MAGARAAGLWGLGLSGVNASSVERAPTSRGLPCSIRFARLERELDRPPLIEYTQVIIKETDRLQQLMDRLLTPNRLPHFAPTWTPREASTSRG